MTLLFVGIGLCYAGTSILLANLRELSRHKLQQWVLNGTRNRWLAAFWGIIINAMVSQSTASTPIIASLAASNMITLQNAIYMAIWGNLGGLALLFVLTLPLHSIVYVVLGLTGIIIPYAKKGIPKVVVNGLFGLSLLIYGTLLIGNASTLQTQEIMKQFFQYLSGQNEFLFIFIGIIAQLVIQSGIVLVIMLSELLKTGVLDLSGALLLICGSRLGVSIMIYIAGSHLKGVALRLVLSQVIFNVVGFILCLFLFYFDKWSGIPLMSGLISGLFITPVNQLIFFINYFVLVGAFTLSLFDNFLIKILHQLVLKDEDDPAMPKFITMAHGNNPYFILGMIYEENRRALTYMNDYVTELKLNMENNTKPSMSSDFLILYQEIDLYIRNIRDLMHSKELFKRYLNIKNLVSSTENIGTFIVSLGKLITKIHYNPEQGFDKFLLSIIESIEFLQDAVKEAITKNQIDQISILRQLTNEESNLIEHFEENYLKICEEKNFVNIDEFIYVSCAFICYRELLSQIASCLSKELEFPEKLIYV